jgi:hypothetical protein
MIVDISKDGKTKLVYDGPNGGNPAMSHMMAAKLASASTSLRGMCEA